MRSTILLLLNLNHLFYLKYYDDLDTLIENLGPVRSNSAFHTVIPVDKSGQLLISAPFVNGRKDEKFFSNLFFARAGQFCVLSFESN
jgi:hypothetical protein